MFAAFGEIVPVILHTLEAKVAVEVDGCEVGVLVGPLLGLEEIEVEFEVGEVG